MPRCTRAARLDSRSHWGWVRQLLLTRFQWSVAQGWKVAQSSCFWGSSWGSLILTYNSDDRVLFARYTLPLRPRLTGPTLGLNHLTHPHQKYKPSPQRQKTETEKARLRVFISMPEPAQTWQTAVSEGKEGRQWQTKPGSARWAARARSAGGLVQGQERGESGWQKLEAPGGTLGSRDRERGREGSCWRAPCYDCTLSTWAERWWCQSRRRV